MTRSRLFLLQTTLLVAASHQTATQTQTIVPPVTPARSELVALVDRFAADRSSLTRRYTVEYSPERYARLTRFYKEWQQERAKVPFEPLGVERGHAA